ELERVRDATLEIATERRTLIAGFFAPTPLPDVQRTELGIGAPSLDVPTEEIAELYAELVSRAAARSRRSARGAPERASGKRAAPPPAPVGRHRRGLAFFSAAVRPAEAAAARDGRDVVAVRALRLRHVHLEPVAEAPEKLGAIAVVDEPVERGEKGHAVRHGL